MSVHPEITVDYEDKRLRRTPENMFLAGMVLALLATTAGVWWMLVPACLCFAPSMTPGRIVCRLFPNDEDWIGRIKLGFVVMTVVIVAVVVACFVVFPSTPGWR